MKKVMTLLLAVALTLGAVTFSGCGLFKKTTPAPVEENEDVDTVDPSNSVKTGSDGVEFF
ncbi:MAG: hypothetical protein LBL35_08585 [Clostridiales bacterium]|jgi:ABC-type oligopeptide transport system substrate-binding subunit|nr:hypothetical protein [Clostridiales bacterium]